MTNITDNLEQGLLDYLFRAVALTQPTSISVGLWTAAPTDAVGAGEVAGGSYARTTVLIPGGWNAPVGGVITNNGAITFPVASAGWGTISYVVLFNHAAAALFWGQLSVARVVNTGDTFTIPSGSLSITLQ